MDMGKVGGKSPPRSAASWSIPWLRSIGRRQFAPFSPRIWLFRLENGGFPPKNAPKGLRGSWIRVSLCGARHCRAATESRAVTTKTPVLPPPPPQKGQVSPQRTPQKAAAEPMVGITRKRAQNGAILREFGSLVTTVMGKGWFARLSRHVHVSEVGTGQDG